MRYKVVLHRSEEGYGASCPGLPGCWSQGATEPEALENIRDAVREYLAAADGLSRGAPDAEVREVDVAVQRCRSCPGSIINRQHFYAGFHPLGVALRRLLRRQMRTVARGFEDRGRGIPSSAPAEASRP